MRAILHIGTEKTGTTSIQATLAASRTALEAAGFVYPRSPGEFAHVALPIYAAPEHAILDLMAREGLGDAAALARYRTRFRRRLTVEAKRRPDACFIFSSEHCHSRLVTHDDLMRLHALLGPLFDTIEIIVYLRRQDRVATSFYSTYLRGGGTAHGIVRLPIAEEYFDYEAMLGRWGAVFGPACIRVVPYDLIGRDIVADFAERLGLPPLGGDFSGARGLNQSFSAAAQEAVRQFNASVADAAAPAAARVREALIAADPCPGTGGREPSRRAAKEFTARFAASNAAVEARYLDGRRLFDNDYRAYPPQESPIDAAAVQATIARALLATVEANETLIRDNAALQGAIAIATEGNIQLRDALDYAQGGNRTLDGLLAEERVALARERSALAEQQEDRRRLEAELGYYAGLVHFDADKIEEAFQIVSKALRFDSGHIALWHLLARIHHRSGRQDAAIESIDEAIRLDPDNPVHRQMRETIAASPTR